MSPKDATAATREARTERRMSWLTALGLVGVLVWVAVPIALFTLLTTQQRSTPITPKVDVWAPVTANDAPTRNGVTVQITWASGEEVFAPAWSGLVESVDVALGQTLESGQTVAIVGGIQRVAVHTERPFARPLTAGDGGADVAALNTFLSSRGFSHGDGDRFTWATRVGVSTLAKSIGVPGAEQVAQFEPSWFVYLPAAKVTVTDITLRIGAPAPAAGEMIVKGEQRIVSARLIEVTADLTSTEPTNAPSTEPPSEDHSAQAAPVTAGEGETLIIGGQTLNLAESRDAIDSTSLPSLRSLVEAASATVAGMLERPPTPGQWTVPSAAILAGSNGQMCVVVNRPTQPVVTRVDIAGQGVGLTVVSADLDAGDKVLVSPDAEKYACS